MEIVILPFLSLLLIYKVLIHITPFLSWQFHCQSIDSCTDPVILKLSRLFLTLQLAIFIYKPQPITFLTNLSWFNVFNYIRIFVIDNELSTDKISLLIRFAVVPGSQCQEWRALQRTGQPKAAAVACAAQLLGKWWRQDQAQMRLHPSQTHHSPWQGTPVLQTPQSQPLWLSTCLLLTLWMHHCKYTWV